VNGRELEDACQEVFLRIFRFLPSFRGEADLKTWLYRLCATEAARVRRRSRSASDLPPPELATDGPGMSARAAAEKCRAALRQMGKAERVVFLLYEIEGLSGHQVAETVGCPVATVWRRLHYARRRFRSALLGAEGTAA
jgi:RNA polymerase sigma-70 factor (ECF subfamily)